MDIQKEREAFEDWFSCNAIRDHEYVRGERMDENGNYYSEYAYLAWSAWQAAKAHVPEAKQSHSITLTCAQLREAFMFGAPDGDDQEQLETEMTITWSEDGHSGKGYYCYYTELPEEGAILLDEVIEAQEPAND